MQTRPPTITVLAGLFLALGILGLARTISEAAKHSLFKSDELWVLLLSFIAVICGAFLLRRQNWARWLAVVWIATHVAISFLNSIQEAAVHALFLLLMSYILFRPEANAWFRKPAAGGP